MIKILIGIFCIFVVTRADMPGRFYRENVVSRWQHRHLLNMSENILKDAMYKRRLADAVRSHYKEEDGYQLGLIAAGVMDKYRHMIAVYRYYVNARDFKNHKHEIKNIMNGYSVIQSDYNEMAHETVIFSKLQEFHTRKHRAEIARARMIARKYKMEPNLVLEMLRAGIDIQGILEADKKEYRRSMQATGDHNNTLLETDSMGDAPFSSKMSNIIEEIAKREGYGGPTESPINEWIKKNANNTQESEYKKSLRYKMWADKWDGFNPDVEGVNIPDKIARIGLKNASDFLMKELKDDFI